MKQNKPLSEWVKFRAAIACAFGSLLSRVCCWQCEMEMNCSSLLGASRNEKLNFWFERLPKSGRRCCRTFARPMRSANHESGSRIAAVPHEFIDTDKTDEECDDSQKSPSMLRPGLKCVREFECARMLSEVLSLSASLNYDWKQRYPIYIIIIARMGLETAMRIDFVHSAPN